MQACEKLFCYNSEIAHKCGLNAAVLYEAIRQKIHAAEEHKLEDYDGYYPIAYAELFEITSLSRSQQRFALNILVKNRMIAFTFRSMPAKKCYKILEGGK